MSPDVHFTSSARRAAVPRRRILLCCDGSAEAKPALERVSEIRGAAARPAGLGESGGDALARFAQALRGVPACESSVSLVMCDTLDLLGGSTFVLDEKGLMHVADALDQLPLLD